MITLVTMAFALMYLSGFTSQVINPGSVPVFFFLWLLDEAVDHCQANLSIFARDAQYCIFANIRYADIVKLI